MVLQNYQNVTEMTSNMIYMVANGVGLKFHENPSILHYYDSEYDNIKFIVARDTPNTAKFTFLQSGFITFKLSSNLPFSKTAKGFEYIVGFLKIKVLSTLIKAAFFFDNCDT